MKRIASIFILAAVSASGALAQAGNVLYQSSGGINVTARAIKEERLLTPVTGAPYSATITNEMIQTLLDGTHITQTTTGTVARDSEGRMRQDAPLPSIGNLSAADAPHLVFIQDTVAQVSYTLDLTNKTAQKLPAMPPQMPTTPAPAAADASDATVVAKGKYFIQMGTGGSVSTGGPMPLLPPPPPAGGGVMSFQSTVIAGNDSANTTTEDLGSQTMQGITVTGTRTTRTISKGQIGNDAPISIVTEVWTSPELQTVVYSKRIDPRMGEQTFQLTNITRSEPDSSLFIVPPDFTVTDAQPIVYRMKQ